MTPTVKFYLFITRMPSHFYEISRFVIFTGEIAGSPVPGRRNSSPHRRCVANMLGKRRRMGKRRQLFPHGPMGNNLIDIALTIFWIKTVSNRIGIA